MIDWLPGKRYSPIGVDLGSRSVKMVQLSADRSRLIDAGRWDLPASANADKDPRAWRDNLAEAIGRIRDGHAFRGREAIVCLSDRQLFIQNIRIPKNESSDVQRLVQQEAAGRIPFSVSEAEVRYLSAADVRQGDAVMREIILLACHRPVLHELLQVVEQAGLRPVAVDVEPAALLRAYVAQSRREQDQHQRALFVHTGYSRSRVVIAQGDDVLFVKYIALGGQDMDQAVARHLNMELPEAAALRRHNGDRRSSEQDPEVAQGIAEAIRPVVDRLYSELSLCIRYHSVTFRGQPLVRLVMGGGEATPQLLESIGRRLDLKCELSDPLRLYPDASPLPRKGQWDVAAGLALRSVN